MAGLNESIVEEAALGWLRSLGYEVLSGPTIAAGEEQAERTDPGYRDVILERRLKNALRRLNPELPPEALKTPSASSPEPTPHPSSNATAPCTRCSLTA